MGPKSRTCVLILLLLASLAAPARAATPDVASSGRIAVELDCNSSPETVRVSNEGRLTFWVTEVNRLREGRESLRFPRQDKVEGDETRTYLAGPAAPSRGYDTLDLREVFDHTGDAVVVHFETGLGPSSLTVPCAQRCGGTRYLETMETPALALPGRDLVEITFRFTVRDTRPESSYWVSHEIVDPRDSERVLRKLHISHCEAFEHRPCEGSGNVYTSRVPVPRGARVRYAFGIRSGDELIGHDEGETTARTSLLVSKSDLSHRPPEGWDQYDEAATERPEPYRPPMRAFELTLHGAAPPRQQFYIYHGKSKSTAYYSEAFCGDYYPSPLKRPCIGGGTTYVVRAPADPAIVRTRNEPVQPVFYEFHRARVFKLGGGDIPLDQPIKANYTFPDGNGPGKTMPSLLPDTGAGAWAGLPAPPGPR